jgi:hypothetical protein
MCVELVNGACFTQREEEHPVLVGFSDSDLASDVDGTKITTGLIFFLGDSPVCWQLARQRTVAMSNYEDEYIAAATTSYQAVWLARLLGEIMDREIGRFVLSGSCTPGIAGQQLWPNKSGYDPAPSSGKWLGNHVPCTRYGRTAPG